MVCARHWPKHFTHVMYCNAHNNLVGTLLLRYLHMRTSGPPSVWLMKRGYSVKGLSGC